MLQTLRVYFVHQRNHPSNKVCISRSKARFVCLLRVAFHPRQGLQCSALCATNQNDRDSFLLQGMYHPGEGRIELWSVCNTPGCGFFMRPGRSGGRYVMRVQDELEQPTGTLFLCSVKRESRSVCLGLLIFVCGCTTSIPLGCVGRGSKCKDCVGGIQAACVYLIYLPNDRRNDACSSLLWQF